MKPVQDSTSHVTRNVCETDPKASQRLDYDDQEEEEDVEEEDQLQFVPKGRRKRWKMTKMFPFKSNTITSSHHQPHQLLVNLLIYATVLTAAILVPHTLHACPEGLGGKLISIHMSVIDY